MGSTKILDFEDVEEAAEEIIDRFKLIEEIGEISGNTISIIDEDGDEVFILKDRGDKVVAEVGKDGTERYTHWLDLDKLK